MSEAPAVTNPTPSTQSAEECPQLSLVSDNLLVETIWHDKSLFAIQRDESTQIVSELDINGSRMKPYDVRSYVEPGALYLPSDIGDYADDHQDDLVREVIAFLHEFIDVLPLWEELIAHYVLMTWVYDLFSAVPYLRFLGEPGTGKTRILRVCGSLCYKATSVSGSISAAGIFRLSDAIRGTLLIDEADYHNVDDSSSIIKVLNHGYSKGTPVIRCDSDKYKPTAYFVFGPKIISTRNRFDTEALESRCLTLQTTRIKLRDDVSLQLPACFDTLACELRNKLLKWRFCNFWRVSIDESKLKNLDSRLSEIGLSVYCVSTDAGFKQRFADFLTRYDSDARKEQPTAIVVEGLIKASRSEPIMVSGVTAEVNLLCSNRGEEAMFPKRVGAVLRSLGFTTRRTENGYRLVMNAEARALLDRLKREYTFEP